MELRTRTLEFLASYQKFAGDKPVLTLDAEGPRKGSLVRQQLPIGNFIAKEGCCFSFGTVTGP